MSWQAPSDNQAKQGQASVWAQHGDSNQMLHPVAGCFAIGGIGGGLALILAVTLLASIHGPGDANDLSTRPEAALVPPNTTLGVIQPRPATGLIDGNMAATSTSYFTREPGDQAVKDIVRWYERELGAMGWRTSPQRHEVGAPWRQSWCSPEEAISVFLVFEDPQSEKVLRLNRNAGTSFTLVLHADDPPEGQAGSCRPGDSSSAP